MVTVCAWLEDVHGLPNRPLGFEIQVETPQSILGPDGSALVARMVHAAAGPVHRAALRHVRLLRLVRDRRRVPGHGPPRRRPRQGRHAGRRRGHRRPPLGRVDQRPPRRRRRRGPARPGACTPASSAASLSAGLLPGLGHAPRPPAHPLRRRRTPSTAEGFAGAATRLAAYTGGGESGSSTSPRPWSPSPASSSADSSAAPSTRRRSPSGRGSGASGSRSSRDAGPPEDLPGPPPRRTVPHFNKLLTCQGEPVTLS